MHEFPLCFSPAFARRVFFTHTLPACVRQYGLSVAAPAAVAAYRLWQGDRSWVVGLFAGVAITFAGTLAVGVWQRYRQSLARMQQADGEGWTIACDDDGLTLSSSRSHLHTQWGSIPELEQHSWFWIVKSSSGEVMSLPVADLPRDVLQTIESRVLRAGGTVVRRGKAAGDAI